MLSGVRRADVKSFASTYNAVSSLWWSRWWKYYTALALWHKHMGTESRLSQITGYTSKKKKRHLLVVREIILFMPVAVFWPMRVDMSQHEVEVGGERGRVDLRLCTWQIVIRFGLACCKRSWPALCSCRRLTRGRRGPRLHLCSRPLWARSSWVGWTMGAAAPVRSGSSPSGPRRASATAGTSYRSVSQSNEMPSNAGSDTLPLLPAVCY